LNGDLEKKLVASCRNADSSAYTQLIKAYSGRVFAICLGMLGSTHDAEDIAQQTLLKALTNIKQVRRDEQFGAWISRIAKNLCIDYMRKQKRRKKFLAEWIEANQSNAKEYPELKAALAKLKEEYRLALMLYYFDGRSIKSVAEVFMISEAAAQARLCRSRKTLRKLLEAEGGI
jgi:RNA polymerase sigma-70 factor (ECF subfamily)